MTLQQGVEKLSNCLAVGRNDDPVCDFVERNKDKSSLRQPGMGNLQTWLAALDISKKKDIQV